MNDTPDIERLRGYLLDQLPDSEASEIELALVSHERSFELLLAVEEELIDDYVRNALTEAESTSFRAYLARLRDGAGRERLARALATSPAVSRFASRPCSERSRAASGPPRRRFLLEAVAAALLLASILSGLTILRLSRDLDELRAELSAREATAATASYVLSAGRLRGAGATQEVLVPASSDLVELLLDLPESSYESYRATLRDAEGRELVSMSGLAASADADRILVPFPVPARSLPAGDYYVELEGRTASEGREEIARFDFRASAR